MTNPRQKRKLRSGHVRKQTRKQARARARAQRQAKGPVVNPVVAKAWNKRKSAKVNFRALGLIRDPNINLHARRSEMPSDEADLRVIRALEEEAAKAKPYKAFCSRGEVLFIQKCLAKHGTNFEAMALDLSVNVSQHSAGQLKAKVKKYSQTLKTIAAIQEAEASEHKMDDDNDEQEAVAE
eukprot:m.149814 g.149814  ORF g.149814 m.149814 type:complete len:181 (-) comp16163_c1_seq2:390-932(-)